MFLDTRSVGKSLVVGGRLAIKQEHPIVTVVLTQQQPFRVVVVSCDKRKADSVEGHSAEILSCAVFAECVPDADGERKNTQEFHDADLLRNGAGLASISFTFSLRA